MICIYCGQPGADRLVGLVPSNSGPGWAQRAHASCADSRGVKVLDERLPAERGADVSGRAA